MTDSEMDIETHTKGDRRITDISVPLNSLMKLPTLSKVCGCIETPNLFNDNKFEPALIVIFRDGHRDGGGVRKGLFAVSSGDYLGEY